MKLVVVETAGGYPSQSRDLPAHAVELIQLVAENAEDTDLLAQLREWIDPARPSISVAMLVVFANESAKKLDAQRREA